jgi:hypothetical protein
MATKRKAKRSAQRGKPWALALSPADLAAVLRKTAAGEPITEAMIRADVELNPALMVGGKVDLVRYAAWLLRRHGYGEKGGAQ